MGYPRRNSLLGSCAAAVTAVSAVALVLAPADAAAEDASMAVQAAPTALGSSFVVNDFASDTINLSVRNVTPNFGAKSVNLAAEPSFVSPSGTEWVGGHDVSAGYATTLYGSQLGVFGGYADRPNQLAPVESSSWNLGALVGYGGFYLRGAFTDVSERGLVDSWQSWQAGFGYGTGNLDVRLTYVSSDASTGVARSLGQLDTTQWMIGGIYQISPGIRVNADAFYGTRELATPYGRLTAAPGASAPQGAGARVGVQLRF